MTQMQTKLSNPSSHPQEVSLSGGKKAKLLFTPGNGDTVQLLNSLELEQSEALIIVVGSTSSLEEPLRRRLLQLFGRGLARAARQTKAVVFDGGTASGIISVLGKGLAEHSPDTPYLGVALREKVIIPQTDLVVSANVKSGKHELEPHHTHFVLVEGENWGDETEAFFKLAAVLGQTRPVVTVLAGGGEVSRNEVVRSVRLGWPVVILKGTGRTADKIAEEYEKYETARQQGGALPLIEEPELAEIVAEGDLHYISINEDSTEKLERLLLLLCRPDTILKQAWDQQNMYSENAKRYQSYFLRLQNGILFLSFLVAFLTALKLSVPQMQAKIFDWPEPLIYYVLLVIPVLQVVFITVSNQFGLANKWLLLRGATETVKQQIYRYRTRTGIYSNSRLFEDNTSRETRLVQSLKSISEQWLEGDVNLITLRPVVKEKNQRWPRIPKRKGQPKKPEEKDDGVSFLNPEAYIRLRLQDQYKWYKRKATGLERRLNLLQWVCIIAAAAGSILVALKVEIWLAVTTSLLTVLTTYLEYRQIANTLRQYNQASTTLWHIENWWRVSSSKEQERQATFDKLVDLTENTLQAEQQSWLQQMKFAVTQLHEQQKKYKPFGEEEKVVVTQTAVKSQVEVSRSHLDLESNTDSNDE
jgi:hypothetical protein